MSCKLTYKGKRYNSMSELQSANIAGLRNNIIKSLKNSNQNRPISNIPTYSEIMQYVMPKEMKDIYDNASRDSLIDLLKKMSKQFNIPFQVDYSLGTIGSTSADGKVSINPDKATHETAYHEFGHPLVAMIRKEHPKEYRKILREVRKEFPYIEEFVNEYYEDHTQEQKDTEIIATALGIEALKVENMNDNELQDMDLTARKNIFQKFWQFISDMFSKAFGSKIVANELSTLKDLVRVLTEDRKINLRPYMEEAFQRDFAGLGRTEEQTEALKELQMVIDANVKLVNDNQYRTQKFPDIMMNRTTTILNEDPYFRYEGPEAPLSIDWGNKVDLIGQMALTGETLSETISAVQDMGGDGVLTEEVIGTIYDQLVEYRDSQEGSVFVPQVTFYNLSKRRAGTSDIIQIFPDGQRLLLDIKTSKHSKDHARTGVSPAGNEYTAAYDKAFKEGKGSVKEKEEAQLSSYKGLAHSKGFRIDHMGIIPFHLSNIVDNQVEEATLETIRTTEAAELGIENTKNDLIENYRYTVENANDSMYDGEQRLEKTDKRTKKIHEKVLKMLESDMNKLTKEKGPASNVRRYKLEKLQKTIKDAKGLVAIEMFINEVAEMFVEVKLPNGRIIPTTFTREREQIMKDYHAGVFKTKWEKMAALQKILSHVKMYEGLMKEIQQFYVDSPIPVDVYAEEGSNMRTISKILMSFLEAKSAALEVVPLMANILGETENKSTTEEAMKIANRYKALQERNIAKIKQTYENKIAQETSPGEKEKLRREQEKRETKEHKKYQGRIDNLTKNLGSEDNILALFETGYIDISMIDAWTSPLSHLPNPIANNFVKIVKRELSLTRTELQEWGVRAHRHLKELDRRIGLFESSEKMNEDLITESNDTLYLISAIDHAKFIEARKIAYDEIDERIKSTRRRKEAKFEWYLENSEQVGFKDKTLKDPITGKKIVIERGINTILEEKRQELQIEYSGQGERFSEAYDKWLSQVSEVDDKGIRTYTAYEFRMPSAELYGNEKFAAMNSDSKLREYYDFLLATLALSHLSYPVGRNNKNIYQLPSLHKKDTDRAMENGLGNLLAFSVKKHFKEVAEEDVEIYGENVYNPGHKDVPIMYQGRIGASETSRDLVASIARYYQASKRYEAAKTMQPFAEATLHQIKETTKIKTDGFGMAQVIKQAKELRIEEDKFMFDPRQSLIGQALEAFIDAEIYGIREKKMSMPIAGKERDINKFANLWSTLFSLTTIAGSPLIAAANYLQQNTMLVMEGVAGEYISTKNYIFAQKEYFRLQPDVIRDMSQGHRTSLIGQLADIYDPQMDNFMDHFGHTISEKAGKRLMSTSTLYHGMRAADYQIYMTSMVAVMKDTMIKNKNGNDISLYDAYELDKDGIIQLKEGIELPNDGKMHFEAKEKMDAMSQRLHGVYNKTDKPLMDRYALGAQVSMFRKFVVPGYKRRFKKLGVDHNLGTTTEGIYITVGRLMLTEFKQLANWAVRNENQLTTMEKANVKRFLIEAGAMILLTVILSALGAKYDEAEDKRLLGYPMYLAYRLRSELAFYLDPRDTLRILRSPAVTYTMIERIWKFGVQMFDPFEEMGTSNALFEKGDSKLANYLVKMFGITGYNANPNYAYEQLKFYSQ